MAIATTLKSSQNIVIRTSLILGVVFVYFGLILTSAQAAPCPFPAGIYNLPADLSLPADLTSYTCPDTDLVILPGITLELRSDSVLGQFAALELRSLEVDAAGRIQADGWGCSTDPGMPAD